MQSTNCAGDRPRRRRRSMSRLSDFRSRSGEHRGPTPIWSTPRRSLHPIPIRWATTAHLPGAKSPFRGKRRRTAAIRRPFRSATSNASSCRNGSLSSRWESKHGRNTAVRGIRNCCLYLPTNRRFRQCGTGRTLSALPCRGVTSRTTPTFRRPFKRSVQSNRTATVRATSWEPAYGGIANRITSNRYEYETKPNDTFPRFLRCQSQRLRPATTGRRWKRWTAR